MTSRTTKICVRPSVLPACTAILAIQAQSAMACLAPERPYLPEEPEVVREYADLLRADFEAYIANIQQYFQCLETERQRAFLEAQEVSRDYGRLVEILE
ncbi:hypothetical protein [Marinovum sp.]|uniref:hypothetical protein n=1 Tax=Marinovum sp. TaxID=2024839 RepID=UPI002B26C20B|nr:hypothetical protein [Marinovum sp.]